VLALVLQQVTVAPFPCDAGAEVVACVHAPGDQVAGLPVAAELEGGGAQQLGVTDAAGELRFVAPAPGLHAVVVVRDGVRIVAPLRVLPAPRRWPYAIVCVPLGFALLWRNLRPRRARQESALR